MFSVADIVRKNNATFYDFRDGHHRSVLPRITITFLFSLIFAYLFKSVPNDFLNGVIATQAILIGFGFNVMFSIGSNNSPADPASSSIEDDLIKEKLGKIVVEIFYNISYFIFAAIGCLIIALGFLFSLDLSAGAGRVFLRLWPEVCRFSMRTCDIFVIIKYVITLSLATAFYFLLAESVFTFSRVVGRVFFIFEKKLRS